MMNAPSVGAQQCNRLLPRNIRNTISILYIFKYDKENQSSTRRLEHVRSTLYIFFSLWCEYVPSWSGVLEGWIKANDNASTRWCHWTKWARAVDWAEPELLSTSCKKGNRILSSLIIIITIMIAKAASSVWQVRAWLHQIPYWCDLGPWHRGHEQNDLTLASVSSRSLNVAHISFS